MTSLILSKSVKTIGSCAAVFGLLLWGEQALAGQAQTLTELADNLQKNVKSLDTLLTIISYIAGVGFCIAGILQFKAHKDNPAQVPLSKPMVYLGVGAALLFLPSIMSSAGSTIFGTGNTTNAGAGKTGLDT